MYGNRHGGSRARRRNVLLIEDNPDGRESLRILLSLMGHRVEAAADGVEGVRKALHLHPDIAIVDIGLPRMDGYQVARRLRAAFGSDIVLLAYTAYAQDEVRQRVIDAGFDAHLVKPMEWSELEPWLNVEPLIHAV